MKKKQRRQMHDELYDLLWHYRFAGGISTHDMAEALVTYIDGVAKVRKSWPDPKPESSRRSANI